MYTLSSFRRLLVQGDVQREVELRAGTVGWLPAQQHHGENIGDTPTHAIFVELKGPTEQPSDEEIGPRLRRATDAPRKNVAVPYITPVDLGSSQEPWQGVPANRATSSSRALSEGRFA